MASGRPCADAGTRSTVPPRNRGPRPGPSAPAPKSKSLLHLCLTLALLLPTAAGQISTDASSSGQPGPAPSATAGSAKPEGAAESAANDSPQPNLESEQAAALLASDREVEALRGMDPTQNSLRMDGVSAEESFGSQPLGGGVVEADDGATDVPREASAGPGSGWRSVESGGRRAGAAFIFSQAAIREFRVEGQSDAATYGSALYGHGVGGVITGVSRSGEQHLHGMGFYTVRSSAWAAADPFNVASSYSNGVVTSSVVKPSDLRQQFGGRIGGPVLLHGAHRNAIKNSYILRPVPGGALSRDGERERLQNARGALRRGDSAARGSSGLAEPRLFYLVAFDRQRRAFPAVSSPGDPQFYRLTAMQNALLTNRGVNAAATNAALTYLASLTGTVDRHADQAVEFGRMDWQRTDREHFIGEYNRARWSNPAGARNSPVVSRGVASLGSSFGSVDMGVARWVRFVTPSLSHELRVQYGHELQYETGQTPLAQEPAIGPGGLPPEVAIGPSGLVFGTPAGLGRHAYPEESRLEVAEVATWTHGRHGLQMGADLSAIRDFTDSLTNAEGTFSYDAGYTNGKAGGLVDWITDFTFNVHAYPNGGCPSIYATVHDFCFRSYSQSFGQQSLRFSRQEWAGFVQDDWRATAALTLHAGVRYEYEFLPMPQKPNAALDSAFGATGATSVYPEDRNNFGPRVGLEWRAPDAVGGVLRLGYGVYFGRLPGAMIQTALLDTATANAVSRIRIVPKTEILCPQAAGVGFGYACSFLGTPAGVVAATTAAVVFDRGFRMPMVQQGTVTLEHAVGGGVLARAGYVTNVDRQLPGSTDINIVPAVGRRVFALTGVAGRTGMQERETFALPLYTMRVSPSFGTVTDMVSHANATYHGMWLEARRGFGSMRVGSSGGGEGLDFRVRWTWSKAIDLAPNASAAPRSDGQFDPFDVRYDKGLSALNQPHRISADVTWTPRGELLIPVVEDRPLLRVLERGWSFTSVFEEASGRPYSYEVFGGTRLTGGRETINGSGGSTVLPTVGRNTLRLPDHANVDVRVTREVEVREGVRLVAGAQGFNVANHRDVSGVQQRAFLLGTAVNGVTPLVFQDAAAVAEEGLNVEPFGTYTSATGGVRGPREVEVSLRGVF
jgi:hypothetical protein